MKFITYFLIAFSIFLLSNCSATKSASYDDLSLPTPTVAKRDLKEIDLTTIKHIGKGRAQDGTLEDETFHTLPIADDLLAHVKDCIPFLISKLDDETEMKRGTIDFWYDVYVGDVALVILNDFFTKDDELTSTIKGFGWDEFLERGNDKTSMGIDILRRYIKKHGRKNIKERWQKMWDENREKIYWDENERCFNIKNSD